MNASDIEKLKQIFEAEGQCISYNPMALIWGGEGIHIVSYEDIIAVLNRGEVSSSSSTQSEICYCANAINEGKDFAASDLPKQNYKLLIHTQPYGATLLSVEDAPQQKMSSVDCGVIVCYLMKQITHKQVIALKLLQSVVDSLRAKIVSRFLNDPLRSWSIQNFHARQQAANDDFEQ
ncbi:hypothetical protein MRB53_026549 [Persea americana]|uniref:Uncharacterized protein n=1 Tax=Persea americana TaxID=3435 RepID=A0ACC2LJ56_PERAE|nr:hypothetical protein MRB53_026549 [Persea americana]